MAFKTFEIKKVAGTPKADETIDVKGKIVLPGAIDPHVHFRDPGKTHKEDFYTGSLSAAFGGVTTVLDMPNNKPDIDSNSALKLKRKEIKLKSSIGFRVLSYSFLVGSFILASDTCSYLKANSVIHPELCQHDIVTGNELERICFRCDVGLKVDNDNYYISDDKYAIKKENVLGSRIHNRKDVYIRQDKPEK